MVGTVQEERGNKGVSALIDSNIRADYAVFGEPTNGNTLTVAYKGCLTLNIKCSSEPGHSSAPWIFPNAIEKTIEVYHAIKTAAYTLCEAREGFNALTVSIREIKGGYNTGVTPPECRMLVEFRVPPSVDINTLKDQIKVQITSYMEENPKVNVDFEYLHTLEPFCADRKSLLVRAFSHTIYKKQGKPVVLLKKSGAGDMSYYGRAFNVPVVTYGPGDPHLSHTNNEQICIEDYLNSIEILVNSLLHLEQLHKKRFARASSQ